MRKLVMAKMNRLSAALASLITLSVLTHAAQDAVCKPNNTLLGHNTCMLNTDGFNVAVVGSGIAGTSAAYFLNRLSAQGYFVAQSGRPVTVTVYEQQSNVGGSLKTVYPPGSSKPLDAGAESFSQEDWCMSALVNAALVPTGPGKPRPVIWNGKDVLLDEFCYPTASPSHRGLDAVVNIIHELKDTASFWWTGRRSAAHTFRHARNLVWKRWQLFLAGPTADGSGEPELADLNGDMKLRAFDLLENLGLSQDFQENAVEPCVRGMFGMNLEDVPGLAPFLGTANPELPPISIQGGSQSLIVKVLNNLVHRAQAAVHLNTQVRGFEPGDHFRWRLKLSKGPPERSETDFDAVIFTSSSFPDTIIQAEHAPHDDSPWEAESFGSAQYFNHHVTHFSTYESLAAGLPENFITTSSATNLPDRGILRVSTKPSFYIDRQGCQYDDECDQFVTVYRIDSRERLEDDDILSMIGQRPDKGASRGDKMIDIAWVDRHVFPRPLPGTGPDISLPRPIQRREGIFDINNAVVDTLEMNCRMGRAVAHELYNTIVGQL